jgi:peroxiredoxin Q/BCP
LSDFRGKTVVIYFYPKDDTPGCTAQACALRDRYAHLIQTGAIVFGVSIDAPESHAKFIAKHSLPFPLVSDERQEIVQAYGVWIEKTKEGKTYMGTERSTFVIRPDGRIKSIFRSVKPEEHAETVIENLRAFEP